MRKDHAAAAVAVELELIHSVALGKTLFDELDIYLPFIPNHLSAGEAANRNDHGREFDSTSDENRVENEAEKTSADPPEETGHQIRKNAKGIFNFILF